MIDIVAATGNAGKLREIDLLLKDQGIRLIPLSAFPDIPEIIEDGETFTENAVKKAKAAALYTGKAAIADDSGLEVLGLDGLPGVRSARFAGQNATDGENNTKLLEMLKGLPFCDRRCFFRSVVALCSPGGNCTTFEGEVAGEIIDEPRGNGGFGYDPHFLLPEHGLTMAELPLEMKNGLSHRGLAFRKLKEFLSLRGTKNYCKIEAPVL